MIAFPVLLEVNFRLFVHREIDQRVTDADHWCCQSLIQSSSAFTLLDYHESFKQVDWVFRFVIFPCLWSENFCLHSCANNPERISQTVRNNTTKAGGCSIKRKTTFLEEENFIGAKEVFSCFINGEVDSLRYWGTESCNWKSSVQTLYALHLGNFY